MVLAIDVPKQKGQLFFLTIAVERFIYEVLTLVFSHGLIGGRVFDHLFWGVIDNNGY